MGPGLDGHLRLHGNRAELLALSYCHDATDLRVWPLIAHSAKAWRPRMEAASPNCLFPTATARTTFSPNYQHTCRQFPFPSQIVWQGSSFGTTSGL